MVKASGGPESGDANTLSSRLYNTFVYICMFYFITCGWPICALIFRYLHTRIGLYNVLNTHMSYTNVQICQARSNPYAIFYAVAYTSKILTKMKTW